MIMSPSVLPDKTGDERVAVYLQLATAIGDATIVSTPEFSSEPVGLIFSGPGVVDGAQTAAVFCAGGEDGTDYVISALCALSTGELVEPVVALPVVSDRAETQLRRPVTL